MAKIKGIYVIKARTSSYIATSSCPFNDGRICGHPLDWKGYSCKYFKDYTPLERPFKLEGVPNPVMIECTLPSSISLISSLNNDEDSGI